MGERIRNGGEKQKWERENRNGREKQYWERETEMEETNRNCECEVQIIIIGVQKLWNERNSRVPSRSSMVLVRGGSKGKAKLGGRWYKGVRKSMQSSN